MAETFWNVSATNLKTEERWVYSGTKPEAQALLKLKLKDWGGQEKANVEWTEHPMPVYLGDEE
jgi:hypothetical protein